MLIVFIKNNLKISIAIIKLKQQATKNFIQDFMLLFCIKLSKKMKIAKTIKTPKAAWYDILVKIREIVETNENKKRLFLNIKGNMLKNTDSAIYGQSNLYEKFSAK